MGRRPTSTRPRAGSGTATLAVLLAALLVGACGSEPRQDANEPEGEFEAEVVTSRFPSNQQLARTERLRIGVENVSGETIPELAITVFTDEGEGEGSFDIRSNQRGLAIPSRPVWILEEGWPRLESESEPKGGSGAQRVQTHTYGFGPMEPGETKEAVWKVTPVEPGTYTLNYEVSAGLDGKAEAVTQDGGEVQGEFVVTISDKPPKTRVNDAGGVVPAN